MLHPLELWFHPLFQYASQHTVLQLAATTARELLAVPHEVGPLHGNWHHGNVLEFGERGWALKVVIAATGIEPARLLSWIIACTGLSAAWFIGDGDDQRAAIEMTIHSEARRLLD